LTKIYLNKKKLHTINLILAELIFVDENNKLRIGDIFIKQLIFASKTGYFTLESLTDSLQQIH